MKNLISLLEQQEVNLNSLYEIITGYQTALISGDLNEMEHFLDDEQKLLTSIQTNLEIQHNFIKEISNGDNLNLSLFSIKKLIDALPAGTKDLIKMKNLMKSLKNLATMISEKNRLNGILINHSRNFIKEVFTSLIQNNRKLLDRKI